MVNDLDLLNVDQQSCDQDGLCAAVCPAGLIDFKKGNFPEERESAEDRCIRCGHCVAVCPRGCMSLRDMAADDCTPVLENLFLSAEQCEQFLKNRRSIRNYRKKAVERETLLSLIDVARYAPSGHNSQGVNWLVLGRKDELQKLAGIVADWMRFMLENMTDLALSLHMDRTLLRWEQGNDVILRGAPAVVIAHGEKESRMAPASCTIALTYLELAAIGMGLGCCWAGYFNSAASTFAPMREALALPDGQQPFGSMMVGYPLFQYSRLPQRQPAEITWRL